MQNKKHFYKELHINTSMHVDKLNFYFDKYNTKHITTGSHTPQKIHNIYIKENMKTNC